jgi:LysM repeat protein/surface antigen
VHPQADNRKTPKRRKSRLRFSPSTLAIYVGAFLLLVTVVTIGYQAPESSAESTPLANTTSLDYTPIKSNPSHDEVVMATVAKTVAKTVSLPVSPNIENLAVSIQIQSQIAQSVAEGSDTKVQLITSSEDARLTRTHIVVQGETLDSIADKYGVSKDTIKWANNLRTDTIAAGKEIKILPTSGALYTIKAGDTLASLATKYKVSEARIVLFNDLELGGLQVGAEIVLPDANVPVNERPGYVAPVLYASSGGSAIRQGLDLSVYLPGVSLRSSSFGNRNALGQCTWYAWERRKAIGRPLPDRALGNARSWSTSLRATHVVNKTPAVGAVIQSSGISWAGHVGVVEAVGEEDGVPYVIYSDMNGDSIPYRTALRKLVGAQSIQRWNYIH